VSPPRRPLALVAGSALAFAVMALAAKLASRTLPGDQIAFLRFLLMLAPFALSPALARRALVVQRLDLLVYRGVFGGVAVLCYFLAIEHLAVGTATLLNYSSPIWAVIFASLFLGEHVEARLLVPLGLALAGLGLVTGAIGSGGGVLRLGVWELVGLASSVLSGAAVTAIRAARRTEGSWSIYGSFTVCGLVVSAPTALAGFRWPDAREWALLVVVGAASVAAQLLMTYAYRWVTNLQAGVFAQLTVVVTMALGVLLLGERFAPSQLAGAALAIVGVIGVIVPKAPPRAVE
jgi:drug/metabolite transporter (DMT)-like permease